MLERVWASMKAETVLAANTKYWVDRRDTSRGWAVVCGAVLVASAVTAVWWSAVIWGLLGVAHVYLFERRHTCALGNARLRGRVLVRVQRYQAMIAAAPTGKQSP